MSDEGIGLAIERAIANIDAVIRPQDVVLQLSGFANRFGVTSVLMIARPLTGDVSRSDLIVGARPETLSSRLKEQPDLSYAWLRTLAGLRATQLVWSEQRPLTSIDSHLSTLTDIFPPETHAHGIIVTARGASGLTGFVIMGGDRALTERAVAYLKLLAIYAFDRGCALQRAELRSTYGLSDREFECMKWVAAGKTDWEIGQILTISPKTVNYHVENAKRKMSVQTRVQAVVSALLSGGINE